MKKLVQNLQYVMTIHAEEEMSDDGLTIFDIESAILTGKITKRQKDEATSQWKYIIIGKSINNENICVVSKLSLTGKLVIITVYLE